MNVQMIPLKSITPSGTEIQSMRRKRFGTTDGKRQLAELAESIKGSGVLQAIVVRLSQAHGRADKYELVAGERRFIAAGLAGLAEIPANVAVLSDDAVLEAQLVENLQRSELHPLEEAQGYEELMALKKITVAELAAAVGRSQSYIDKRKTLLHLGAGVRKAFFEGTIDGSRALLLARIPHHDLQAEALKQITRPWGYGEIMSYSEALDLIQSEYMLRLKDAPFDIADANLVPKAGTCAACPKRTGNQSALFSDVKNKDMCTDPVCFQEKREATHVVVIKQLEAKGKTVLHGAAARKIFPHWKNGSSSMSADYLPMNHQHWSGNLQVKVSDLLGADYKPLLVMHPASGQVTEVATRAAVMKAAANPKAKSTLKKRSGPDVDEMLDDRLAQLIHKNAPKTFTRSWLLELAKELYQKLSLRNQDSVALAFGWPKSAFRGGSGWGRRIPQQVAKLDERGLVLFMFQLIYAVGPYSRDNVLKLFSVNEDKTRELIIAERKAAAKAEREAAKAARAKSKKKGK